jgi:PKD repeat protein
LTSNSTDSDGTVTAHAWDFGDGATGTGTPTEHTYAQAGTYDVTLTVTDDDGATGTVNQQVTVNRPATDTFTRSVTGGWGSADTGGVWTRSGSATSYSVADGKRAQATGTAPDTLRAKVWRVGTTEPTTLDRVGDGHDRGAADGRWHRAAQLPVRLRHQRARRGLLRHLWGGPTG